MGLFTISLFPLDLLYKLDPVCLVALLPFY